MIVRLVRAEFLKLRTTQVWFWMLLVTIAVAALFVVAQVAPSDGISTEADTPFLFASFSALYGYVLVFVLGVLGVTTEFRYQTITPTLLQTPSRWTVVAAKMITYAIVGAVYAAVVVIVEAVVGIPWLKAKHHVSVDLGDGAVQHAILGTFGVVALFGIIGLGVGALLRNQIVAVSVGIVFLAVISNVLLAIPTVRQIYPYIPAGGAQAVVITGSDRSINGVDLLGTGGGVLVLLLWAFVPAVLGAAVSLNRDIT